MFLSTQPYRGTRDFLPNEMSVRTQIFETLFRTVEIFGFRRYDGPILEPAAIYEAKSGKEIVDQQMYRFTDKGDRDIALRPEMTPSVARMIAGNQADIVFPSRWYSHVNCHRYERPQKGRVREHWQLNLDIFGSEDIGAEVEMFDLIAALFEALGADSSMYVIRVNDRVLLEAALTKFVGLASGGLSTVRAIIDHWEKIDEERRREELSKAGLSDDQVSRLESLLVMNLDAFVEAAGHEAASGSSVVRIIHEGLTSAPIQFDPHIMRGFDYYTSTVFEVFDRSPENRRSMFGGGRYDDLASLFTDRKIPGIGCGMGDVTTWAFLEIHGLLPKPDLGPDVFVFATSDELAPAAWSMTRALRSAGVRTVPALDNPSPRVGLRFADRLGVRYAVIIGESEYESGCVSLKDMLTSDQATLNQEDTVRVVVDGLASDI